MVMPVMQIREMIVLMMQSLVRMNMDVRHFVGQIFMLMKVMLIIMTMEVNVLNLHMVMSMAVSPDIRKNDAGRQ